MHAVWPIVVAFLTGPPGDRPAVSVPAHVRAAANAATLLDEAAAQSATVRELIRCLDATDVIVYVELTPSPQIALARTKLVTATATTRFLRIGLKTALPRHDVTPIIAHELQHAVEIARQPDVRDENALRHLYQRIGHQHGVDQYETDAAGDVERRVRAEVRRTRSADTRDQE
jgi:hypothetical protein